MSEHGTRFTDTPIERDPEFTACHRKPARRLFGRRRPSKLERALALVGAYEADLQRLQPSPVLRSWGCGEVTICVDAALRVVVTTICPIAFAGDLDLLVESLYAAQDFAKQAADIVSRRALRV